MTSSTDVAEFENNLTSEIDSLNKWFSSPRWEHTTRRHNASQVAAMRSSIHETPLSNFTAKKLYKGCRDGFNKGTFWQTFGALDPVQVATMAKYLPCIYVSGWQCSSTASTTNEPGPDFADYPMNTVPNKVDQLFRAQLFHDRRQREERARMTHEERLKTPTIDYLRPIIADGDTGFGGITSVLKLAKLHIEAGAAGIHIEDQKPGSKRCGHLGGRVCCSMLEMVDRMCAARLMADIMGTETVLIARTDACGAQYLDSNVDPRDHPFIAGSTNPKIGNMVQFVEEKVASGESREEMETLWLKEANLKRYQDAVADAMRAKNEPEAKIQQFVADAMKMSNSQARLRAAELGYSSVFWDWDAPKVREGYFRALGGVDWSAQRAIAFGPYSDLIWMETSTPNLDEAALFAKQVHAVLPHQMLAYNLSPSFNWDAAGMDDATIASFQKELGKMGFAWQFITLCGFHANGLIIDQVSKAFASEKGVLAYVELVQREERRLGVETLTHQRWSGAELMDKMTSAVTGGANSIASLKGATEAQFSKI